MNDAKRSAILRAVLTSAAALAIAVVLISHEPVQAQTSAPTISSVAITSDPDDDASQRECSLLASTGSTTASR